MNLPTQKYSQDLRRYYRLPVVQMSLTMVLSLFVLSVFIIFALRPTVVSITTLKKTIAESESTLKQLETKIASLQKVSTELESLQLFLPILNTSIPNNGATYAPLITSVESLANQTGTKLENESIGPTLLFSRILSPFSPNKNQKVIMLPFTVKLSGTFPGISDFLTKLLTMDRIIGIESVIITKEAISTTASKDAGVTVSLNINGSTYYLADETQINKALVSIKEAR